MARQMCPCRICRVRRARKTPLDRDDIVADTFEIVYRNWNAIRTPKAYLYKVATRTLGTHRAALARQITSFETDDDLSELGFFWWRTPEQTSEHAVLNEEFIAVATGAMTTAEKIAFLRRTAGYSNNDVATELRITPGAAQHTYERARDKARRNLQHRGLHPHHP